MEGVRGQFCGGSLGTAEEKRRVGQLSEQQIHFLLREEKGFPGKLAEIPDPPYGIFYRGKLPDENEPAVAVIGARECSEYGRYVAEELGQYLGRAGIQVISGMDQPASSVICGRNFLWCAGMRSGYLLSRTESKIV